MAIPFAVPSDEQGEAALGQLLLDLIDINQQIQILLRSRAQNQIATISPRVCTPRRTRNQSREVYETERMPDLVTNLPFLPSSTMNARTDLDLVVLPAAQSLSVNTRRSRRQRTSSESSCCEESKYGRSMADIGAETDHQDWTQVGVILRKIADDFQPALIKDEDFEPSRSKGSCGHECSKSNNSLLSKLVPAPIKSSLWTAVICVVGWHLFRAR